MRISDWSSDVCSSDLKAVLAAPVLAESNQLGRCAHRSHDCVILLAAIAMAMREHRKIAVREGGLLVGDRIECDARLRDEDRKSGESGKSVSDSVDLGGRRIIKKKTNRKQHTQK